LARKSTEKPWITASLFNELLAGRVEAEGGLT
jgi:hypothetical protein